MSNDSRSISPSSPLTPDRPRSRIEPADKSPRRVRAVEKDKRKQQHRREKRDVHGWVVLDKPIGMTSTHAVAVIRRLFTAKRAGHAGTLDPLATGCLPIALGEATKTVPFIMDVEQDLPLHRAMGRGARHRRFRRPRGRDQRRPPGRRPRSRRSCPASGG